MAFSACKVPINERARACMKSFHKLRKKPAWKQLPQEVRDRFNQRAIAIDEQMIAGYDALNSDIATVMDGRGTVEEDGSVALNE